jgi:hypothetical protein
VGPRVIKDVTLGRASGRHPAKPWVSKRWVPHSAAQVSPGRVHWVQITDDVIPLTVVLLVILLVVSTGRVDAINLAQCGDGLRKQQGTEWNKTHTEPPPQFNLTYEQCLAHCGSGMGDIDWVRFSETFSSWLLPWIALMFQIPFGAEGELYTLSGS